MNSTKNVALGVFGLASLAFALPLAIARAQEAPLAAPAQERTQAQDTARAGATAPAQEGIARAGRSEMTVPAQEFPGQFTPAPPMAMMPPMPGGGQATMMDGGVYLFILRGNQLLKVRKSDLAVEKMTMLPSPEPRMQMAMPGQMAVPPGTAVPARPRAGGR
ncbi:MAG: hypothetical protein JSS66_16180 [Armatimonadetes bacterium]|nr:hypothetical protein [Armatimonadota bacterium]